MSEAGSFARRYGPWALVAGASEGLGQAFARAAARRGLNLVLLARRASLLEAVAAELREACRVEVRTSAMDLGAGSVGADLARAVEGLEVGLCVYNAAFAPLGDFLSRPVEDAVRAVEVNCRGPLVLAHALCGPMVARGRGGLVLMSSLTGLTGTAALAAYSATKSFNRTLAEALWKELSPRGVDVLACCAGAVLTPGLAKASQKSAPGSLSPDAVAERTLAALSRGPSLTPGALNTLAAFAMTRLMPRRMAVNLMASTTRSVVPPPTPPALS